MFRRVDKLAELGTTIVTISGGEPLLHPQLDDIIRRVRSNGIIAGMITNGYLLTADRIQRLNRAGLEHLQISIDNVKPDDVSKKSLKMLDKKLQLLAEHAEFHVNINSVVGGGIHDPHDAMVVGNRAVELGFTSTVGIIHNGDGQLMPLGEAEREVYHAMKAMEKGSYARINGFQDNIAAGRPNEWRCRAGQSLPVCLRRRARSLLLTAARISRQAAGAIHRRRYSPRVCNREKLRSPLHRFVRAPGIGARSVAWSAEESCNAFSCGRWRAGSNSVASS